MEYNKKVTQRKKDFSDSWQKAMNETGENAFKKFTENWHNWISATRIFEKELTN